MRNIFRGRRLAAAVVAALTIAGPIALTAQPTSAALTNVHDLGVDLQVAQATANPTGPTEITWQNGSATVRQGYATLLRVQVTNAALVPELLGGSVSVNTGGRVDTGFEALSSACSVNGSGSTDVVTCTYGTLLPGASSGFFSIPVATPATGTLTHTASVPNELLGLPLGVEAPDSDSVTTTVTANSSYGFVTEGESISFSNGSMNVSLTAPNNMGGGGAFVNIYQGDASDSTCGEHQCAAVEARTDWVQVGGTAPTANDPFKVAVHYPGHQTCNGTEFGGPCNPLFFFGTGVTGGAAEAIPFCLSGEGIAVANPDPCVYDINPVPGSGGERSILVAILEDAGFPIPLLGL